MGFHACTLIESDLRMQRDCELAGVVVKDCDILRTRSDHADATANGSSPAALFARLWFSGGVVRCKKKALPHCVVRGAADRPFTESEVRFLRYIRRWGKKVVFLLNKVDILASGSEVDEVLPG